MNSKKPSLKDYSRPVAYDANNQPLYAHPPSTHTNKKSQTIHLARPVEPEAQLISEAVKRKHDQSKKLYPALNLSDGEYVILSVTRNPIGLLWPLALGLLLIGSVIALLINFDSMVGSLQLTTTSINSSMIILPAFLFIGLILIGMYVIYYVYKNNEFFLTNESVIQEIQVSLFSRLEQTVSLINIEDASFTQIGIIQQLFNYGSIRLSTEGEETTYRFSYVSNPKQVIATLNNAVEAFKNGRPITSD